MIRLGHEWSGWFVNAQGEPEDIDEVDEIEYIRNEGYICNPCDERFQTWPDVQQHLRASKSEHQKLSEPQQ